MLWALFLCSSVICPRLPSVSSEILRWKSHPGFTSSVTGPQTFSCIDPLYQNYCLMKISVLVLLLGCLTMSKRNPLDCEHLTLSDSSGDRNLAGQDSSNLDPGVSSPSKGKGSGTQSDQADPRRSVSILGSHLSRVVVSQSHTSTLSLYSPTSSQQFSFQNVKTHLSDSQNYICQHLLFWFFILEFYTELLESAGYLFSSSYPCYDLSS